jgi:Lon protease-like protein
MTIHKSDFIDDLLSCRLYSRVLQSSRLFGLIGIDKQGPDGVTLSRVGCILRIVQCEILPDGRSLIHTRGYQRFTVKEHWVEVCFSPFRF